MSVGPYRESQKPEDKFTLRVIVHFKSGKEIVYFKSDIHVTDLRRVERDEIDKYYRDEDRGMMSAPCLVKRASTVIVLELPTSTSSAFAKEHETKNILRFHTDDVESTQFSITNNRIRDENFEYAKELRMKRI